FRPEVPRARTGPRAGVSAPPAGLRAPPDPGTADRAREVRLRTPGRPAARRGCECRLPGRGGLPPGRSDRRLRNAAPLRPDTQRGDPLRGPPRAGSEDG